MYNSLGVPMSGMIDAIECLKVATLSTCEDRDARFVEPYFDFLISGMS